MRPPVIARPNTPRPSGVLHLVPQPVRPADIEAEATVLRWYEPLVVPGLLQTEDYARAILSVRPDGNLDDLDDQVAARLARQSVLDRPNAPQLWSVLDEGVLHRAIGGPKVMRSQLYRLAEAAEHPKTTIQVIRTSGAHAGLLAHFVMADRDGQPPVVYLETAAEGHVTDSPSVTTHVALRFDRLRAQAESWATSRDLIKKVADSTTTPERKSACRAFTSAEVTADQRTASRKAARRSRGSKPPWVTSGSDRRGRMRRPGSTSQMTGRDCPYLPSSTLCRVSRVLPSLPGSGSSPTTHL